MPVDLGSPSPFLERLACGVRVFGGHVKLWALLALDVAVVAPTAMEIVSTVVFVRDDLRRPQLDIAILAASGSVSVLVAASLTTSPNARSDS